MALLQDVLLPFGNFLAVYRGKALDDTELDASKVVSFQIMISKFGKEKEPNDKFNEGPFRLNVLDVSVYKEHQRQLDGKGMQRIVHVSSAGVTIDFVQTPICTLMLALERICPRCYPALPPR